MKWEFDFSVVAMGDRDPGPDRVPRKWRYRAQISKKKLGSLYTLPYRSPTQARQGHTLRHRHYPPDDQQSTVGKGQYFVSVPDRYRIFLFSQTFQFSKEIPGTHDKSCNGWPWCDKCKVWIEDRKLADRRQKEGKYRKKK